MGLFDSIIGGLTGNNGGVSPMQSILMNALSSGQAGGLGGLVSSFEQAGLGHIAQSWIGNGANQPVSPQQLQSVLGDNQVNSMANQSGMAPQDFLSQLSQHLPNAVNAMTPNGRLPDEGSVSV
jgi:uncharacterized protein YidB (DUF937 family)